MQSVIKLTEIELSIFNTYIFAYSSMISMLSATTCPAFAGSASNLSYLYNTILFHYGLIDLCRP